MTATFDHRTHPRPELEFVDVPLLDVYRRLNDHELDLDLGPQARATKAGCLEFVAAVQQGGPPPAPKQAAMYRKMLRRLLELEATPPPKNRRKAGRLTASRRATPSYVKRAGQTAEIVQFPVRQTAELEQLPDVA